MKNIILRLGVFTLIVSPLFAFGYQLAREYKSYEFFAQIETRNGNAFVYKVDDPNDSSVKCYVLTNDFNATNNGTNFGISCVKVK